MRKKPSRGPGTDRLDVAVNELVDIGQRVNVTLGARGALVASGHARHEVAGFPARAVDTNGAGDIFARCLPLRLRTGYGSRDRGTAW